MIETGKRSTVLITDGGGRGSSLVEAYARSDFVGHIIAAPGNDMMQELTDKPVTTLPSIKTADIKGILDACEHYNVDLVDVCQDNAVEAGVVDKLQTHGIPTLGPTRKAGAIEFDKAWARKFGTRHNLTQPEYFVGKTLQEGREYVLSQPENKRFVKASGLAQGKGAVSARSNSEAEKQITKLKEDFPQAAETYLIEEWIDGEEFSTFVVTDGTNWSYLGSAQDHKRAFDNDGGDNTGGMGCSTPPLLLSPEIIQTLGDSILTPTIQGLSEENRPYTGVLYLGGMITKNGKIYVVEFNARHGDPEAQVILPGLENDMYELGMAILDGELSEKMINNDGNSRVVITGASRGYPNDYKKAMHKEVKGFKEVKKIKGVKLYGAGVTKVDGKYYTNGGRLFYIVGEGKDVIEAREKAYTAMELISIEGDNLHYRKDIGWRDVQRLTQAT